MNFAQKRTRIFGVFDERRGEMCALRARAPRLPRACRDRTPGRSDYANYTCTTAELRCVSFALDVLKVVSLQPRFRKRDKHHALRACVFALFSARKKRHPLTLVERVTLLHVRAENV